MCEVVVKVRSESDLTTKQVLKILNLKQSRFQQWLRLGYIKPYLPAMASGKNHYFVKEDLYIISLFIFFLNLGFNRWIASEWSRWLDHESWYDNVASADEFYLLITGDPSQRANKNWKENIQVNIYGGPLVDLNDQIKNNPGLLIVNLKKIQLDIDAIVGNQSA